MAVYIGWRGRNLPAHSAYTTSHLMVGDGPYRYALCGVRAYGAHPERGAWVFVRLGKNKNPPVTCEQCVNQLRGVRFGNKMGA